MRGRASGKGSQHPVSPAPSAGRVGQQSVRLDRAAAPNLPQCASRLGLLYCKLGALLATGLFADVMLNEPAKALCRYASGRVTGCQQ